MTELYKLIVPASEIENRMINLRRIMDETDPEWRFLVIVGRVNIYYLSGTMPDGLMLIPRDGEAALFVRRTYERARAESAFQNIYPMESFRDAAEIIAPAGGTAHLESELMPYAYLQRFLKYFPFDGVKAADGALARARSAKSPFELDIMRRCGSLHEKLLDDILPSMLFDGMSETDLSGELYKQTLALGGGGLARFAMFQNDSCIGHICFGESALCETSFNGPNGNLGLDASTPINGSRTRLLRAGDHILCDVAFSLEGYNTDKTQTYSFKAQPDREISKTHEICFEIQEYIRERLRPGEIPSRIYADVYEKYKSFTDGFMGYENRTVKFIGHGVGLTVDEYPVIARGFDEPLRQNMTIALEPKKGVRGKGMAGLENTFAVTEKGGVSMTGLSHGLITVR